jgi:hypothetical protein
MRKTIVITTINPINEFIEQFHSLDEWNILLVGDKKSPEIDDSGYPRLKFLDTEAQADLGFALEPELPYNNYTRKNLGYLYAILNGAERLAETDDDNGPKPAWGEWVDFPVEVDVIDDPTYPNVYKEFTNKHVWPRGYPLDEILTPDNHQVRGEVLDNTEVGCVQALVDTEPDVDAIYRMTNGSEITFDSRRPVALGKGVYSPFNSQNTLWYPHAYEYLYLPVTASHRYLDILRGYVAVRGLAAMDYQVLFTDASAVQNRNYHDLMADFDSEVQMYLRTKDVVKIFESLSLSGEPRDDIQEIYKALYEAGVVEERELECVNLWIKDLDGAR